MGTKKKLKYPKKFKSIKTELKFPRFIDDRWWGVLLRNDGSFIKSGFVGHHTESSCWICCKAHNKRVGYSAKKVIEILKSFDYVKEEKRKKKQKAKSKKAKNKNRKSPNKT